MDARKVKDLLSERDIFDLLEELGAAPVRLQNGVIECITVCHRGSKRKLYYYHDKKIFNCYTNCGVQDIFGLIQNILESDFSSAYMFIVSRFGLKEDPEEVGVSGHVENPGNIFRRKLKPLEFPKIDILPESLLNTYYDMYHKNWIDDNISIQSMKKYGIKYSIEDNQIIIPHRDQDGKLIGIRGRNLNENLVKDGKKYMPVYSRELGRALKHPTGANLYGLDKNKDLINETRAIILFESEKSVLQLDSFFPELSIGVCISGSSLTDYQISLLNKYNINEVIIGLDKEFDQIGDQKEKIYAEKIEKSFVNRLSARYRVSVLWDLNDRIPIKSSPSDLGKETFIKMMEERIFLN